MRFEGAYEGWNEGRLTQADAAQILGMCERSLRDALRRGEVPCIKIGKRYILPRSAIAEWLRTAGGETAPLNPVSCNLR